MNGKKKAALLLAAVGLIILMAGNGLLAQRGMEVVGRVVHVVGSLSTLSGLLTFICLNAQARGTFARFYTRTNWVLQSTKGKARGNVMVFLARCLAVFLAIVGIVGVLMAAVSLTTFVRPAWNAWRLVELVPGILCFASGIALWLIADIAQGIKVLYIQNAAKETLQSSPFEPNDQPSTHREEGLSGLSD